MPAHPHNKSQLTVQNPALHSEKKSSVCFTQNSPCMVISSVCLTVMQRLLSRLQSQYSIIHPIVFFISHSMDGWAAGERSFFCGREGGKSIAFIWRNCREIVKMTSPVMRLCWVMTKQYPCCIKMEDGEKAKKKHLWLCSITCGQTGLKLL